MNVRRTDTQLAWRYIDTESVVGPEHGGMAFARSLERTSPPSDVNIRGWGPSDIEFSFVHRSTSATHSSNWTAENGADADAEDLVVGIVACAAGTGRLPYLPSGLVLADLVPALQAPRLGTRDSARAPAPTSKVQALPGSKAQAKKKPSQCQSKETPAKVQKERHKARGNSGTAGTATATIRMRIMDVDERAVGEEWSWPRNSEQSQRTAS
ncbi:hypothetical protein B0H13DRAFT_2271960 [Mycena leptocephala]|nr:hypothetical protein B0H13DRAFT_2271960 [Mycena leptocephala]